MTEADLRAEAKHRLNIYRPRHKHVARFEAGLGWNTRVVAKALRHTQVHISCRVWQPAAQTHTQHRCQNRNHSVLSTTSAKYACMHSLFVQCKHCQSCKGTVSVHFLAV